MAKEIRMHFSDISAVRKYKTSFYFVKSSKQLTQFSSDKLENQVEIMPNRFNFELYSQNAKSSWNEFFKCNNGRMVWFFIRRSASATEFYLGVLKSLLP